MDFLLCCLHLDSMKTLALPVGLLLSSFGLYEDISASGASSGVLIPTLWRHLDLRGFLCCPHSDSMETSLLPGLPLLSSFHLYEDISTSRASSVVLIPTLWRHFCFRGYLCCPHSTSMKTSPPRGLPLLSSFHLYEDISTSRSTSVVLIPTL
ncbi:hypothetical protein FIU87_20850 [Bacillus sp. THAF10]|nr:hypothetical protein FIU87_20850 [Bacillus sp. THAF10]